MSNSFFDQTGFINFKYAVKERMHRYWSEVIFGDLVEDYKDRVIYASNDYAFRKRQDSNKIDSTLDFPFINFRMKPSGFNFFGDRGWWSPKGFMEGLYCEEIQKKVRLDPVAFSFEATMWVHRDEDLTYIFQDNFRWNYDNQTQIDYSIMIDGVEVPCLIELNFDNLDYDPEYKEPEWLEQNKIHSISFDFTCLTHLYRPDSLSSFGIPEKVLFDFYYTKNGEITGDADIALEFLQSELAEE